MTTYLETSRPTSEISDKEIINTLVSSHGDINLSAERLHTPVQGLVDRLPDLPYETLTNGIKTARLLQAYDVVYVAQEVMFQTLAELSPDRRSKFLLEFMDRFERMLNPPTSVVSQNTVNVNMGSQQAQDDARASLAERLIHIQSRSVRDVQDTQLSSSDRSASDINDSGSVHSPLRLGVDSAA